MNQQLSILVSICLRIWFAIQCFEGVLRFELEKRGLASLIYARDILLIIVICASLYDGALIGNDMIIACTALAFFIGSVVGLLGSSASQVIFGLKILLPLITGLMLGCSRLVMPPLTKQASLLCLLCMVGLVWNHFRPELPWTGASQEVMGVQVINSRQWHHLTGGSENILRPAGFSRASYSVSNQLVFLGIFVLMRSRSEWRFVLWLIVLAGIGITTSKGAILSWLAVTAIYFSYFIDPENRWARRTLVYTVAFFVIALPCLIFFENFENVRFRDGTTAAALTDSFADRLINTWPEAFRITLAGAGGIFLGRGIGGLGMPITYFTQEFNNAGDNIFVFLFVVFGLPAFLIFGAFVAALNRLQSRLNPDRNDNMIIYGMGIAILSNGLLAGILEDPLSSLSFGAVIGRGLACRGIYEDSNSDMEALPPLNREMQT